MSLAKSPRRYTGVRAILPPDLQKATRAPTSADKAYVAGTLWLDTVADTSYMYPGSGNWITLGSGTTGAIVSLTADSGGAISPVGGNIDLLGTANQITTTGTAGTITFKLPNAITAPGSLTTTTTLTAGTNFSAIGGSSTFVGVFHANITGAAATVIGTGGTGIVQIGNATGNTAVTGSLTASTGLVATTGGITATGTSNINTSGSAVTSIGTGGTGATNIGNATGNTAVTGSVTASTTLTATLGAITATNGNLVLGTAGNKIMSTSVGTTTSAGANSFGSVTLSGGTATVSTTAVKTGSLIVLWRQTVGATGAAALGHLCHGTITDSTSFVINSNLTADATALATTDVSVVGYMIIN